MTLNFMESESYLFTSESVTEGHPDKICDQISDGVLDAMLKLDPRARVACEVSCTTGLVIVMGEISISEGYVDIPGLVRNTLKISAILTHHMGLIINPAALWSPSMSNHLIYLQVSVMPWKPDLLLCQRMRWNL